MLDWYSCRAAIIILVFLSFLPVSQVHSGSFSKAASEPEISLNNGDLSVTADNAPLMQVLEKIASRTGMVIFVSDGLKPESIKISFSDIPMEEGLKRILKGLDYVTIYSRNGDSFIVSAIRIYPKGKKSGPLKLVMGDSGKGKKSAEGSRQHSGSKVGAGLAGSKPELFIPVAYTQHVRKKSLIPHAIQFEETETEASKKLLEIRRAIQETSDETESDRLTLNLMIQMEKFEEMQVKHRDFLESLYRSTL